MSGIFQLSWDWEDIRKINADALGNGLCLVLLGSAALHGRMFEVRKAEFPIISPPGRFSDPTAAEVLHTMDDLFDLLHGFALDL